MTPLELFYPRTEWLPWSCCIPGLNDSPGVVLSQVRTNPLGSFYARTEWLPWGHSMQGHKDSPGCVSPALNDSPGVVPSKDRRTPLESFHQDWLHWSRFIPWQKDFPSSRSIQGLKDSSGVHLSWDESRTEWLHDRMTSLESFHQDWLS